MTKYHEENDAKNDNLQLLSRRKFIGGVAALVGAATLPNSAFASVPRKMVTLSKPKPARALAFESLHTGEKIKLTYWEKGNYVKGALAEINHILRDHRTGDVARIDIDLLDQLHILHQKVESRSPFLVISGYRSPKTNAMLHEASSGVAKKSMHTKGRAIDIRLEGADLANLHRAALAMNAGGVGYYPSSQFVHVDTGAVRHWG